MPECGERELFERAKAGDRAAFDSLRGELETPVRRFVQRLVGQSDSEDDIVQDAFLALYMNLERLDPIQHLRPFLFRVVRNRCYDELRRKGRFQLVSLESDDAGASALPFLMDQRPRPDEAVLRLLAYSEIQAAIDRLPEMQRHALILYCEEDLSYAQIAEVMGTDIGTVKSRIFSARRNLVKVLPPELLEGLGLHREKPNDRHARR